jgi:PAS domain S-box-containing protein
MKRSVIPKKPKLPDDPAKLRRHAETRLSDRRKGRHSQAGGQKSEADAVRVLHELEVHQIELEMQNAELQKARDELEGTLEKYTDLYDFAPVGYFSIDESGVILEANLTGATYLGVERSRLINRRLLLFISPTSRPLFLAFLKKIFTRPTHEVCEAQLLKEGGGDFWAGFQATSAVPPKGTRRWCKLAFVDITARKQAEEAHRGMEALAVTNRELREEIARRQVVEEALVKSEHHYGELLEQSRHMQDQLRLLSRQLLSAQEEERKKISRELHDVIAQTLTSINLRLATLKADATANTKDLRRNITRTQKLVEHSVNMVHRFARQLRPTLLDDLGLIPALQLYMKGFKEETGIHVSLSAFAAVKQVNGDKGTVLYRVAQEALNNVARHAQASRVDVSVQKLDDAICLKIADNGKGFPTEGMLHAKTQKRLGLLGMRERLEMVNGNFTIESVPGKGTTILAQIPLADVRARGSSLVKSVVAKLST